jgi:hypothetical protein
MVVHNKPCDRVIAGSLLEESWDELSDSIISAGWNFSEMPVELDSDDSPDDDEFALSLDSDREEWNEEYFNAAPEEDR